MVDREIEPVRRGGGLTLVIYMRRLVPMLGVALIALGNTNARAHGIHEGASDRSSWGMIQLGFEHMVIGYDHLLFVLGLLLLAPTVKAAAKLVSIFALGHSLTLIIATLAEWQISPTAVDVVIALSVAYVGLQGLLARPRNLRVVGPVVLLFGLIHGLGLSTRLQDVGLQDDGLLGKVIGFNVGVELGQLGALAVIASFLWLASEAFKDLDDARRKAFAALVATGLIIAIVLAASGGDDSSDKSTAAADPAPTAATGPRACAEEPFAPPMAAGGGHLDKQFYGPEEQAPSDDLLHVLGDGYMIVTYGPKATADQIGELEDLIVNGGIPYVIGAAAPGQSEPLAAITRDTRLRCKKFAIDEFKTFRDERFDGL